MNRSTLLSLTLAVLHGVSGILVLMVSTWFIAACAIAPATFNYMIPAVAVRGLALLRIASGYAHLWLGHEDVLARTSEQRLALFQALHNKRFNTRAEGVEALAQHTQAVASVWVGWVAQQASAVAIVGLSLVVALQLSLPGMNALLVVALVWLLLSAYLVVFGFIWAEQKNKADEDFRFSSEHFLRTSALWHLYQQPVATRTPSARQVWRRGQAQELSGKWYAWGLQAVAYVGLFLLLMSHSSVVFAEPLAWVIPLLLLAVPEWLGRSLAVFPVFAQWRQSRQAVQRIANLPALLPQQDAEVAPLTLTNFAVPGRAVAAMNVHFPITGLAVLLGSSGAGKSSLLQAMAGTIDYLGERFVGTTPLARGPVRGWCYVEQTPLLINGSLRDNLYPYGGEQDDLQARFWLDRVGLTHLNNLDEWLGCGGRHLSGGERKRLLIARTALTQPKVWLVDEPFEGLDAGAQQQVAAVLSEVSLTSLVIIATHIQPKFTVQVDRLMDLDVGLVSPLSVKHQQV
jgi:ATP-binding cassette subfamily C protein CydC